MNNLLANLYVKFQALKNGEEGQDLVEYALVVALIAFGATAGMGALAPASTARSTPSAPHWPPPSSAYCCSAGKTVQPSATQFLSSFAGEPVCRGHLGYVLSLQGSSLTS